MVASDGAERRSVVPDIAGQIGRFCCSMYCLTMVRGAPPTVPAK